MKITLIDHINAHCEFTQEVLDAVRVEFRHKDKDAHMTAAYKLGMSDGFVYMIDENGFTYVQLILDICEAVDRMFGVQISSGIEIIDERPATFTSRIPELQVPEDYVIEETGYVYRDYQQGIINTVLNKHNGVVDAAPNAGKTVICMSLAKVLDPYVKTLTLVPSDHLGIQTQADYDKADIDSVYLSSKTPKKKRFDVINKNRHIVTTTKLFNNMIKDDECPFLKEEFALIVDEAHIFGELFAENLRLYMGHCGMRIGVTGSTPKHNPLKWAKMKAILGGDVIYHVSAESLVQKGVSEQVYLKHTVFKHKHVEQEFAEFEMQKMFDWSIEQDYYENNIQRMDAVCGEIVNILTNNTVNTLILSEASTAERISNILEIPLIRDTVTTEERIALFERYKTDKCTIISATFGTASTGLSVNEIDQMILVDTQKDPTRIIQSLGRGARKNGGAGVRVFDLSSDTKYARKHRRERNKIYKQLGVKIDDTVRQVNVS